MSTAVTSPYTAAKPYDVFNELRDAGWTRNFDLSPGGHLCIPVDGAPALGGNAAGGLLYSGTWTSPDGTSLIQRSNMDRSVTTLVLNPQGLLLEYFISPSLVASAERIAELGLV